MLRALYTAGTGMVAQQHNLDVISNNLANVNTTGFRGQTAEFQDLMYQTMKSGSVGQNGGGSPQGIEIGLGTKVAATATTFTTGSLQETDNPLNVAITGSGQGFFRVIRPDGSPAYTRDGTFKLDSANKVVTSDGMPLDPDLTIPPGSTAVTVSPNGDVFATNVGAASSTYQGKIQLANVANPGGMARLGGNLFAATAASGEPVLGAPGENGTGTLQGGYVEGSNVEVVSEMTHMITAQRAYEINSKAIQTADDMLGIVNGLKR